MFIQLLVLVLSIHFRMYWKYYYWPIYWYVSYWHCYCQYFSSKHTIGIGIDQWISLVTIGIGISNTKMWVLVLILVNTFFAFGQRSGMYMLTTATLPRWCMATSITVGKTYWIACNMITFNSIFFQIVYQML